MKLLCKNCGAPVPARNVNVQTMTAVCENCDSVFTFEASELIEAGKRRKIERPASFDVQENADGLRIHINWRRNLGPLEKVVGAVFAIMGSLLTLVTLSIFSDLLNTWQTGEFVAGSILGIIALGLWYLVLMFLVNHSEIRVENDTLSTRHYPLYWPGLTIAAENIERIETEPIENMANYHYLRVVEPNGTRHTIDNYQVAHAQYLKHRLEHTLFAPPETDPAPSFDRLAEVEITADGELRLLDADEPRTATQD